MIENLSRFILNFIRKYSSNEIDPEVLDYGIQLFLYNFFKLAVVIILAVCFGVFKYILVGFLSYIALKTFSGGFHLKSAIICLITSLLVIFLPVLIAIHLKFSLLYLIITLVINLILILKYAPADTEGKPIVNKKLRKKLKIKSVMVLVTLYLISAIIHLNPYSNIIIIMLLMQCILITPLAYKIFNRRYNNYEDFKENNLQ